MRGLTPLLLFVLPAVSALSPQFLIRKISTSASIASSSESKISDIDFDQDLVSVVIAQDEDADSPYTARVTHPSFPEYSIRVAEPKLCDPTVQQVCHCLFISRLLLSENCTSISPASDSSHVRMHRNK